MVTWSIFSCELRAPLDHLTPPVKPITPKKKKIPACMALWKENRKIRKYRLRESAINPAALLSS
jgi:hypothetical protein